MKIKYDEGPAAVTLDRIGRVERGKSVEVPDDRARQLLEQGWQKVGGSKGSAKKTSRRKSGGAKKTSGASALSSQTPAPPADDNPAGS